MTIYGWDMSHYDSPGIGSAVAEGYVFITHKAGGDATDQELDDWWASVRGLGGNVLLGAYWVLYPGTPVARADAFLARLDQACPGWRTRDSFILQVDCEKWGGNASTVPGKGDVQAFCDRLTSRTDGDYRPIVYAPKWVYGDSLVGLKYPLWASSYVTGVGAGSALYVKAGGDGSARWGAYSGQVPAILQFSSSATIAGQTTCDVNAFRGTLDQLKALAAPGKVDMTFEADQVPVGYPAKNPANPTWAGPAALGSARDLAHEARDQAKGARAEVAALKGQLTALSTSLTAAIVALAARDAVDEVVLGRALSEGVAASVSAAVRDAIAELPADRDDISQDEVSAAVREAIAAAAQAAFPSPS